MKIGWLYDKNIWYYLNNDGSMAVNRSQDAGTLEQTAQAEGVRNMSLAPITGDGGS